MMEPLVRVFSRESRSHHLVGCAVEKHARRNLSDTLVADLSNAQIAARRASRSGSKRPRRAEPT